MGRMIEQADAQCKIHAAFMGGFEPCRYDVWAPGCPGSEQQEL